MKALVPPLAVQWDFPEKKPQNGFKQVNSFGKKILNIAT
ncbi:MAG: hypothetical protein ACJAXN_002399 [Psychromonas sp.]|jgi:hypothetical protein